VLSIAHLSDSERMFFVTTLLNEVVAWMRSQSGSRSLRAILYMDEVFGYAPPSANPPSKQPLLTLLKQARAFGLGVVLASQNPVDLDYKALANAGTWFLGRMQTERDRERVLAGLDTVATTSGARVDRGWMQRVLAGLESRRFLLNNVHEDGPVLFDTRWVLSYLGGPLTRQQIQRLTAGRQADPVAGAVVPATAKAVAKAAPRPATAPSERPHAPPGVDERFLPVTVPAPPDARLVYRPAVWAEAGLHYANARAKVDAWSTAHFLAPSPKGSGSPWGGAQEIDGSALTPAAAAGATGWTAPPAALAAPKTRARWSKMLGSHLYRERPLVLWTCKNPKGVSDPDETEGQFRGRMAELARDDRDLQIEKLRARYTSKLARIEERIRKAEQKIEREKGQVTDRKLATAVSVGSTLLGALFGRKLGSAGTVSRAGTAARSAGRIAKEKADVDRARAELATAQERLVAMEEELAAKLADLDEVTAAEFELDELLVRVRKSDTSVEALGLAWTPWWVDAGGVATPAFAADGTTA